MRLIDADKLVAHLKDEIEGCKPLYCGRTNGKSIAYGTVLGLKSAIAFIEALATIEAEPVVHGEWEWDENGNDWGIGAWICSKCKCKNDNLGASKDGLSPYCFVGSNYCPHCGVPMRRNHERVRD